MARSKRVVNEEIVQDRSPDLDSYGRWASADFFDCMTDSQQQTLDQMSMQFWDGEPASHKDIVNYFRGLLKKADDLEEENDKLEEEFCARPGNFPP